MSNSVNSPELLAEEDATTRLQAYLERWLQKGGTYDPVRLDLWRLLGEDAAKALLGKFPNVAPTSDSELNAPGLLEVGLLSHIARDLVGFSEGRGGAEGSTNVVVLSMVSGDEAYLRRKLLGEGDSIGQWELDVRAQQASSRRARCFQKTPPAAQPLSDVRTFVIPVCVSVHLTALVVDAAETEPLVFDSMMIETSSQHKLIMSMFREFVTRMMKSPDPGVPAGLCWENVTHLLRVAEAEARTIPVAVDQRQEDIWTCGWRVLFFIYCLLKLKPEDERRAALLRAGTCREFSTEALESFRNNVVQQRSAQDGVIQAPTDTDIVPMDLCARVGKPEDGLRPFTPWAARRIAQVRGWKSVSMGATVALVETVLNQDPSSLIQQEAAAGKAPERAVRRVDEVRLKGCTGVLHAPDGVFFAAAAFNTAGGNRRTSKCKRCVAVEAVKWRKSTKRLKGAGGSSSVPPAVHEGGTPMELISPSQALRARFIGNKQLQSGQPTPFKLDLSDAQKTLLEMVMECLVDMSSKQWSELGFGIQGGRIQVILPPEDMLDIAEHTQVMPYVGEKEGKVDPWKLWHWARSAPETLVGKRPNQMKRKALFPALLELRRAFVAGAEKAGELAPGFWSWPVIALLFTPANAPAQITHIDGQAPNLQAILACTCHCRPTEVYRGPQVSFTDAVKHIRYRGYENHRLTERTLAETDPGAANFITSHKNLMQPLEDLERGMGVPEENKPYMEQYHGYMFGSDTTHRGPAGAPVDQPGGKPCLNCQGRGNVRLYGQGHLLGLPGCGRADDPTQYTPFLAAYNEALYPHITPRSDAAEKRNHELAAQYVAHFGEHAVLPNHLYSDEDYASIHARAKELRLVVEAAAPAAAAAASIPP
eukprot:jgi/Tetstr1/456756/TSEL_043453.t1